MNNKPYVKELLLNKPYKEVYDNIIKVSKAKNYSLVEDNIEFNRCVLEYHGLEVEVNIEEVSEEQTKLKIMCKHKGKYFDAQNSVMKTISKFEEALLLSFKGELDTFDGKDTVVAGDSANGCLSILIFIAAMGAVLLGITSLFS